MIIKDITEKKISITGVTPPFKKNTFPNKIDKTIEIVIVPKLADITANQKNVGIIKLFIISYPRYFIFSFQPVPRYNCPTILRT